MLVTRLFNSFIFLALLVIIYLKTYIYMAKANPNQEFAQTNGSHFAVNGKPLYLNGFNAYWMLYYAGDPSTKVKVTAAFQQATKYGMNIARTWAFSDGGYRALQVSPGSYNEDTFKALDFVVAEAREYGVYVILSLVNNFNEYGGRPRYVEWARERGQSLKNEDDFYTNAVVKQYYKNHVKAVLTRINSITGVAYKDDPTIFAWELMNEPRCPTDPSGTLLQEWITEMAAHVKSIDNHHLLEVGLEGFYGESVQERQKYNPNNTPVGTDFITNNQIPDVDFATIHIYPEQWLPPGNTSDEIQLEFVNRWIQAHIQDSDSILKKPILIGEFGKSYKYPGYSEQKRNSYFQRVYDAIYDCAKSKGPCGGGLFWQLMTQGMTNFGDGYEVVMEISPSTANILHQQSLRLAVLSSIT
ncbi:hypothetical protein AB3S75_025793 [Citrus x aurantiifolia]